MVEPRPLTLTPYSTQTLFKEIIKIREGDTPLETFILKTDLLNLKDYLGISEEIGQQSLLKVVLDILIKVEVMEKKAPEAFRSYLNGIGYLNKCDHFLRQRNEPTSKKIIESSGLAHMQTLVYLDLKVRGRTQDFKRLNKQKMKEEIENEYRLHGCTKEDSEVLEGLNERLADILKVLSEPEPKSPKSEDEVRTDELLKEVEALLINTREKEKEVSDRSILTESILVEVRTKLEETNRLTSNIVETSSIVESSAQSLNSIKTNLIDNLKIIGETKEKLITLDKGIKVMEDTLLKLNNLIRQDVLLEMSKTENNIEDLSKEIESLGKKYTEWRKM